ncbi:hypothetical protein HY091_00570 [Candidatus Kaiserbacteria bacterium]|nr:hypothetical protein [Candidatus Kaiserbacteria bacterium]
MGPPNGQRLKGFYPVAVAPLAPADRFARPAGAHLTIGPLNSKQWPKVILTPEAHGKMWALVQTCEIEVGWLSTCFKTENGDFVIDNVFVPGQRCTAASTTITKDGEAGLLDALLRAKKYESINRLGCWGHSHVNMAVFASGIDETQTTTYLKKRREQKHDHFIRVIANKHGDFFCSLYQLDLEMVLHNPPLEAPKPKAKRYLEWAKGEIERNVTPEVITAANFAILGSELDAFDLQMLDGWFRSGFLDPIAYERLKLLSHSLPNQSATPDDRPNRGGYE